MSDSDPRRCLSDKRPSCERADRTVKFMISPQKTRKIPTSGARVRPIVRNRPLWVLCRRWREIYPSFLSWQKSVLLDLRDFSERNVNSSRPCGAWAMKRPTLTPCCSNTTAYTRDSSLPGIGFERSRSKAVWHRQFLRCLRDNVHSADQTRTASGRLAALNQYG